MNVNRIGGLAIAVICCALQSVSARGIESFWLSPPNSRPEPLVRQTAVRGSFELRHTDEFAFRIIEASWFKAWLCDQYLTDGFARFPGAHPECDMHRVELPAGRHVVAVLVHRQPACAKLTRQT